MPFNLTPSLFDSATMFFLLKIFSLTVIFFYIIFAIVVVNQVKVMNRVIQEKFSSALLAGVGLAHVIFALVLFVAAIVIL